MLQELWRKKIIEPLNGFLRQGLSAKKLTLCLALGITIGTFPVLGMTTILCTLAALIFKLNMPVIQFANYLVYPLQIVLLVPFYYLGDLFFNAHKSVDIDTLRTMLIEGTNKEMIMKLLDSTLYAVGAWLLISPLVLALLYKGLKPIMVRLSLTSPRLKFLRR
ncbi:MAG: DUF2062 domain-containing protein [Desulfobacterales bacterium]|jgi:uncharacterized protein (DUF2062 family)